MQPALPEQGRSRERQCFATTHWSVVLNAGDSVSSGTVTALEELCRNYWYPIYSHIRRRGHDVESAKDLTQEFFAKLIEKNWLQSAERERGRFRTFLLAAVEHFLSNEKERAQALKRGGNCTVISWDAESGENRYLLEAGLELSTEKLFDRRWAVTLLEKVIEQLRVEYSRAGKSEWFETLQIYLSGETERGSFQEITLKLKISEGAARVAVHRLRKRYGQMLREQIANTVSNETDIDGELRYLLSAVGE